MDRHREATGHRVETLKIAVLAPMPVAGDDLAAGDLRIAAKCIVNVLKNAANKLPARLFPTL